MNFSSCNLENFAFSSFLVNSQDRVIRVFDREMVLKCDESVDPEPVQKLQDLVNRSVRLVPYLVYNKLKRHLCRRHLVGEANFIQLRLLFLTRRLPLAGEAIFIQMRLLSRLRDFFSQFNYSERNRL